MKIYSIISALAALLFLTLFLRTIPVHDGGGQYESSPNDAFEASASDYRNLNPLISGSAKVSYEFTLSRSHLGSPFKRVVLYPPAGSAEMNFRNLPKIITWKPDSSEVTFNIPGATLTLATTEQD